MNKFYVGEPVLYINGDKYNIGIIKSRHELSPKYFWKGRPVTNYSYRKNVLSLYDDIHSKAVVCFHIELGIKNEVRVPLSEYVIEILEDNTDEFTIEKSYAYQIWYHTGDTVAYTHESDLREISNSYAFTILRKQADMDVDAPRTCKELATTIVSSFNMAEPLRNKLIAILTSMLSKQAPYIPVPNSVYLECALYIVIRDILSNTSTYATDNDINSIIDIIINKFTGTVLDTEMIDDAIKLYFDLEGGAYAKITDC